MNEFAEIVWRRALEAKGKDWVMAELQRRAGHPSDAVYDIVFEEPYPTREFCQQWCAEEENKLFHVSWHTYAVLAAFIVTVCCCVAAVKGLNSQQAQTSPVAVSGGATATPMRSGPPTNAEPNSITAHFAGKSARRLPDICAYQTYQTDECKPQQ